MKPGEILSGGSDIVANRGRRTCEIVVANTGDRPVQIGAHYHFFEVNKALEFDREKDRKSTRLNSSHGYISYAVFCLKKKKKRQHNILTHQSPPVTDQSVGT